MEFVILEGSCTGDEIACEKTIDEMRVDIENGKVVVIRNAFDQDKVRASRASIHKFGLETPQSNPQRSADTINFHRIDDDHPAMSVKRVAHFYRFSYHNENQTDLFQYFKPMNVLRNRLAGLDVNYTFYEDYEGYLSQPAVLHYPRGGGHMAYHVDPYEPQRVEMVMVMSERGKDFQEGGLQIKDGSTWVDVEGKLKYGDICMFRPDVPHGVSTIDGSATKDWTNEGGRWILFSPIAHIGNSAKNEKEVNRY